METNEHLKAIVKERYTEIVANAPALETNVSCCGGPAANDATACCTADEQAKLDGLSGCGCGLGCGCSDTNVMAEDYSNLNGYVPEADLALGCGIPTDNAGMKLGDTVLDLGSGAGNDVFVARRVVGETGRVIGVDMTEAMLQRANANLQRMGYKNVEFRYGDIENLPVASRTVDVVLSNCVLNLVPDKQLAFAEMFRVLRSGGHFSVSDIVLNGLLPEKLVQAAEMFVGCVSGAMQKTDYLRTIDLAGFTNVAVKKTKPIVLPDDVLLQYLNADELQAFKSSGTGIESVTVYGVKP